VQARGVSISQHDAAERIHELVVVRALVLKEGHDALPRVVDYGLRTVGGALTFLIRGVVGFFVIITTTTLGQALACGPRRLERFPGCYGPPEPLHVIQLLRQFASFTDPCGLFHTHPAFHSEIVEDLADVCDLRIEIETVELLGPCLVHTARPYEHLLELGQ